MTKEITKAYILQEIQDKFKLRELIPEKFVFSEEVVPTYNISPHLVHWEVMHETVSITSATGYVFFTVPQNEQWLLRAFMIIFGGTGAHKATGVYIDKRPGSGDLIYLDMEKSRDVSYTFNLPTLVPLYPGNELRILIDSYTSNQDLDLYIDVQKEEIR